MSITPFRPFIRMSDYNLIKTFWKKTQEYNKFNNSDKIKYEINELIRELKYRNLKLSDTELLYKILF